MGKVAPAPGLPCCEQSCPGNALVSPVQHSWAVSCPCRWGLPATGRDQGQDSWVLLLLQEGRCGVRNLGLLDPNVKYTTDFMPQFPCLDRKDITSQPAQSAMALPMPGHSLMARHCHGAEGNKGRARNGSEQWEVVLWGEMGVLRLEGEGQRG